ncbi:MAG: RNA polymerase sigma factor [Flavobacteriia bacterium]|nr:RNA polymerase sigma factor [Flavobacteriia bacterium]
MFQLQRKKYKQMSDEELILLYKQKQLSICIGILYERYGHLVMGTSLKYLKKIEDAQDVSSKIFEELPLKICKHHIEFFKSWLYIVTKNECFQLLRKKGQAFISDLPIHLSNEEEKDEILVKEKQISLLESAIDDLKPEQKKCIQLFFLEEKSYQEISDFLQIPLMKVKSFIQNGKRNIKIQLEELKEFKNEK